MSLVSSPEIVLPPCPQSETTYVSLEDGRTSGHSTAYASVRVTCPHIDLKRMLAKIFAGLSYICYPHKGSKTGKEHCHVLVPDATVKVRDQLKTRLNRNGYVGNETFSIKGMNNGILCGIQYASREGTEPIIEGDLHELVKLAPAWKQTSIHSHMSVTDKPDKLRDWQLNYSNLVPQAVHFAKVNRMGDTTLKSVVKEMIRTTKWRPCKQMYVGGVPDMYSLDFDFRMGRASEPDMSWWRPNV